MWERAQQHPYPNDTLQAPALGPQVNQGCENEAQFFDKKLTVLGHAGSKPPRAQVMANRASCLKSHEINEQETCLC